MTDKRKYKYTIVFIILGIGVLVLLGCNIRIGSVSFSVQEVLQALLHKEVLDQPLPSYGIFDFHVRWQS